jgi:ATP-binding cassette subfamily F protein 3
VLVLDEPTNHLDMRSKDILKNALLQYSGTLIVVSHDREFLDGLVDKVYEFKNQKVKEHLGGIFDFLERRKLESLRELERKSTGKMQEERSVNHKSENKRNYTQRREHDKKVRKVRNELEKTEADITRMEQKLLELEKLLAKPVNIPDFDLFTEYSTIKAKHDRLLIAWEKLHTQLEEFEKHDNIKND